MDQQQAPPGKLLFPSLLLHGQASISALAGLTIVSLDLHRPTIVYDFDVRPLLIKLILLNRQNTGLNGFSGRDFLGTANVVLLVI